VEPPDPSVLDNRRNSSSATHLQTAEQNSKFQREEEVGELTENRAVKLWESLIPCNNRQNSTGPRGDRAEAAEPLGRDGAGCDAQTDQLESPHCPSQLAASLLGLLEPGMNGVGIRLKIAIGYWSWSRRLARRCIFPLIWVKPQDSAPGQVGCGCAMALPIFRLDQASLMTLPHGFSRGVLSSAKHLYGRPLFPNRVHGNLLTSLHHRSPLQRLTTPIFSTEETNAVDQVNHSPSCHSNIVHREHEGAASTGPRLLPDVPGGSNARGNGKNINSPPDFVLIYFACDVQAY
jgi:hypothetical protein